MIRFAAVLLGLLALGAEPTRLPVDPRDALLDRGSSMGFIPLASPAAARDLRLYLEGFFRDESAKGSVVIPRKALRCGEHLADFRAAGATHLVMLYHAGDAETEYLRILLLGPLTEEGMARLESAGLGRRGAAGSFELVAFKDDEEQAASVVLSPLPVARLAAFAQQVAAESSGSVDLIDLTSKDAPEHYLEALREAFAEEGQPPEKAEVPPRAQQVVAALPFLRAQGATQLVLTAHQNAKGADIVLIVAKGAFSAEAQARLRATYNPRVLDDGSVLLQRWVDGEDRAAPAPSVPEPKRHPFKK